MEHHLRTLGRAAALAAAKAARPARVRGRGARARGRRGRARGERGELLIETLITISLVAFGVVAIVGALGTVIGWSNDDRSATRSEALLWSYAEAFARVPYEACTVGGNPPYGDAAESALPAPLPDGTRPVPAGAGDGTTATMEMTVASVAYWNGSTAPAEFVDTCAGGDTGVQALTLSARSGDDSAVREVVVYKRAA